MDFSDLSGLTGTRLTDPLNKKSFIFVDVTDFSSAAISAAISVNSVDIPEYEIDSEEKNPLNENRKYNIIKSIKPSGDLTLTRGNFLYDFYAYNMYSSIAKGNNSSISEKLLNIKKDDNWSPRRNFLLIHYANIRWLQYLTLSMEKEDLGVKPEDMASRFLNTSTALDFTKVLNSGIPGVIYLFKDCLVNNIQLSDGFDASSNELVFTTISFAIGDMNIFNLLNPTLWKEIWHFLDDEEMSEIKGVKK